MKENARLLIVFCDKPAHAGMGEAYAHPRAWVRTALKGVQHLDSWGDTDRYGRNAGEYQDFMLHSQIDSHASQPYAIRYGFEVQRDIMTAEDVRDHARVLQAVERSLQKDRDQHGACPDFGTMILRLARAIKADYIVLMPPRPWSDDTIMIGHWSTATRPGDAVYPINDAIAKAHKECVRMVNPAAASI